MTSIWQVQDDVEGEASSVLLGALRDESRHLMVILVDGSARTRLHVNTICDDILHIPQENACYLLLVYGDYPPASPHTVETVYCGGEWEGLLRALRQWPFYGGTPVRNALHEGVAAAILAIRRLRPTDESSPSSLVIIGTTLYYEDFQTNAQVRAVPEMAGQMMEAMLTEVKDSGRIRLSCYFSSPETAQTFSSILGRIYGVEELRSVEKIPTGWTGKTTESKTSSSIRSSSGESINFDEGNVTLDAVESTTNSALEGAVRQFLTAVLKLPHNQRADAIKRHLESPAYSAEYKQSLVSMVRQMQNVAKSARKTQPPSTAIGTNGPPPQRLAPSPSLATVRTLAVPPIWRGRVAFRANADTFFDVAAIPIPNPKSMSPQTTPMASEYNLDSWPLVLAVASFVSVQSPAVIKSVPVSKLVELIAINSDGLATPSNEPYVGFRNLLATRQLVGLVRLGSSHAMLLAARPHQLVGMVLSRQAASAAESYHAEASRSIHTQPPTRTIIQSPPQRVSPRTAARVLTPDAILRQQRKPTPPDHTTAPIPMDSTSSTPTLDVFNALMGSQAMDFENVTAQSGSYDLSDFGYPDASQDMSNSFFDMSSA